MRRATSPAAAPTSGGTKNTGDFFDVENRFCSAQRNTFLKMEPDDGNRTQVYSA